MAVHVNDNTTWKVSNQVYINDNGTWKEATVYVNDNGDWKIVDSIAGSLILTTPGTTPFTIPAFTTLTIDVWSGGGGGNAGTAANSNTTPGGNGGNSSGLGITCTGGQGGQPSGIISHGGAGGVASGGNVTNLNGNPGGNTGYYDSGAGGNCPNGGAGGPQVVFYPNPVQGVNGVNGGTPGGGGSGGSGGYRNLGAGGGSGAYARSQFTTGQLTAGAVVNLIVGAGGVGSTNAGTSPGTFGGNGGPGKIIVQWT